MKRRPMIMGLLVATLMVAMLPGVAWAAKATTKTDCKNGGWQALGYPDAQACKDVVKAGGTPGPVLPDGVLAIAYTNLDGSPGYGPGDVLIAQWVDNNGNGAPDVGDVIEMGKYPRTLTPSGPADFGTFGVASHPVDGEVWITDNYDGAGGRSVGGHREGEPPDVHSFAFRSGGLKEGYGEGNWSPAANREVHTELTDGLQAGSAVDIILVNPNTGSRPNESSELELYDAIDNADSAFIDVDLAP